MMKTEKYQMTTNFESILNSAYEMMEHGVEPRSALKQCASDAGISYGHQMEAFVKWAEAKYDQHSF